MSTMLDAGVDVMTTLRTTADKMRDPRAREALQEVAKSVQRGEEIAPAMIEQGKRFPTLFIDLCAVGEKTGTLPEVLRSLSNHYENAVRLQRDFINRITGPLLQLVAAICIIALLIFVLGILPASPDGSRFDVLGLGLYGASGAAAWLFMTFGTLAAVFVGYKILVRNLAGRQFLDPLLMKIPILGHCMRSFAIARFSWAFALTQQAGMAIRPSLRASFRATANGAFMLHGRDVWERIRSGEELTEALAPTGLFPEDYIQTVHVAETSGTVPEALDRLSPHFEDDARRSLVILTVALSRLIWAMVAVFIIYIIFSIFLQYIGFINDAARGT